MATRIRKGARTHLYIAQWRERAGLSVEQLAGRLDVDRVTMWRWETGRRKVSPAIQAAIAKALDIEASDLWHLPNTRPSIDAMVRGVSDETFSTVVDIVRRLTKTGTEG